MALKQRHAKLLLEFLDLPAERRLRHVQLLGGLADGAVSGNGGEVSQMDVGHRPQKPHCHSDADLASSRSQNCTCAITLRSAQSVTGTFHGEWRCSTWLAKPLIG